MLKFKYINTFENFINESKMPFKKGTWLEIVSEKNGISHLGRFINKNENGIIILDCYNDLRIMRPKNVKAYNNMKIDENIKFENTAVLIKS